MKIKYANTLEDHVNFVKNDQSILKTNKKIVVWFSILSILIFMSWKINIFFKTGKFLYLIEGIAFSTICIVVFIYAYKRSIISLSKKHFENKDNEGFFCEHEIVIDEFGITEITETGSQQTKWSGITKIEDTDDYLYIYISSVSAHVIPKKRVEGNIEEFKKLLKQGYITYVSE